MRLEQVRARIQKWAERDVQGEGIICGTNLGNQSPFQDLRPNVARAIVVEFLSINKYVDLLWRQKSIPLIMQMTTITRFCCTVFESYRGGSPPVKNKYWTVGT